MSRSTPPRQPDTYLGETRAQGLQRKLPYYLLGLAIGCIMVGVIVVMRQRALGPTPGQPSPPTTQPAQSAPR